MNGQKLDFQWSLKPIIVWMKFFGFQLDGRKANSYRWICCLGAGILLINWVLHLISFISGVKRLKANGLGPNGTNSSTANLLNTGIEHLNYACMVSGIHTIFFIVSITSWKSLMVTLKNIDLHFQFKPKFYHRCRKTALTGLVFIALDSGSYVYTSVLSSYWDLKGWRSLAILLANVTRTVGVSILIFFCVMIRCTSLVYEVLNHRLETLSRADEQHYVLVYQPPNVFASRLDKWRKNHVRASHLVETINECFGYVMLLTVANGFVTFVTNSYEIVRCFQYDNSLPLVAVINFFKKLIQMIIFLNEINQLQMEASKTIGHLRKLHTSMNCITQLKQNCITLEVSQSLPRLTAREFFDVNLRLIPTLIGTTLTYVAILCQASAGNVY